MFLVQGLSFTQEGCKICQLLVVDTVGTFIPKNDFIYNLSVPRMSEGSTCLNLHYKGSFVCLLIVTSVTDHILLCVRHFQMENNLLEETALARIPFLIH